MEELKQKRYKRRGLTGELSIEPLCSSLTLVYWSVTDTLMELVRSVFRELLWCRQRIQSSLMSPSADKSKDTIHLSVVPDLLSLEYRTSLSVTFISLQFTLSLLYNLFALLFKCPPFIYLFPSPFLSFGYMRSRSPFSPTSAPAGLTTAWSSCLAHWLTDS